MTRTDAATLARDLMRQHGLEAWSFAFDRAKKRLGCCHHDTREITLSHYHLNRTDAEVRDTILHEIAHALLSGTRAAHGPAWRAIARRIGARPERCGRVAQQVAGRFQLRCTGCGYVFECHKRRRYAIDQYWHKACGPTRGRLERVS